MGTRTMTSSEFNQDTGGAKRSAEEGPVFITEGGCPSHVLLTFADYQRLARSHPRVIELLTHPRGIGDVEFHPPRSDESARPAEFD